MEWLHRHTGVHPKGANPFKGNGSPTRLLKIALLFIEGKSEKNRKDILIKVGVAKDRASANGQNSSLFSTLMVNGVIEYDKENKVYKSGNRFKEYLQYCAEYMSLKGTHKRRKKLYLSMLKESSQAMHFMLG